MAMPNFIAIYQCVLFIGSYRLTLTFDLDLTNDLAKRCVAYLFIIVQGLIEKYAFILFP
jgi:hypothetical protein